MYSEVCSEVYSNRFVQLFLHFDLHDKMIESSVSESVVLECKSVLEQRLSLLKRTGNDGDYLNDDIKQNLKTLFGLLEGTVARSEGNSILLIGPRGAGKTWLLERAFQKIDITHKGQYTRVQLNGAIHTDDGLALKEIAAALQMDNELDEKPTLSFASAFSYLLDSIRSGDEQSRPVIFVLDEFDCFTQHHNQTLLYNLFDMSQTAQTPIAVIGLTSHLDVIELLEKRVKSRFSHRQIHVFNTTDYQQYTELFKTLLSLPEDFTDKDYRQQWQQHLEKLVKDNLIKKVLRKLFEKTVDIWSLKSLMIIPVSWLSADEPFLRGSHFHEASGMLHTDTRATVIPDLSVLELTLLVAIRHYMETSNKTFNFEIIYKQYKKFTEQATHSLDYSKQVVLSAFEHLQSIGLVYPADCRGVKGNTLPKQYCKMNLAMSCREVKDAVQAYPNCPTDLQQWNSSTGTA